MRLIFSYLSCFFCVRMRILDDDIDVTALVPSNVGNTLDEDIGDDTPTVADVIDERPEHVQQLEKYRQDSRWKRLAGGGFGCITRDPCLVGVVLMMGGLQMSWHGHLFWYISHD